MRILALIPARGGSKRVPNKNIKLLGSKPLINWTIDVVRGIPEICEVLVSTDSKNVFDVANLAGAFVPWLRPESLAQNDSKTKDVAIHALDWYESHVERVDGLLILQPTSPFRSSESIQAAINLYKNSAFQNIISVSPASSHPMWALRKVDGRFLPFHEPHGLNSRSQDLPEAFVPNGSIYLVSPENLRNQEDFYSSYVQGLVIDSQRESLDIDTEEEFRLAEFYVLENQRIMNET